MPHKSLILSLLLLVSCFMFTGTAHAQTSADWYMAGANPQRTSHLNTTPTTNLNPIWHRPIEAYIPQNVNLITVNDQLYLATANGLLVFNANNGQLSWRFNTDMPLGNSPTVYNGYVFAAGYDRKVHILDTNGNYLTSYNGAKAGYSTNPLVLDRSGTTWVYLGDRNGVMHAFTFNGSSVTPRWTSQAGFSGIHFSPAYQDNKIYFASNDNYAYALDAGNGSQVWKSDKLPGWGYFSWWPVVDTQSGSVVFSRGAIYRAEDQEGDYSGQYDLGVDLIDIFAGESRTTSVSEMRGHFDQKPWRRTVVLLDLASGVEVKPGGSYAPFGFTNTKNGNAYPPVIGEDGTFYSNSYYDCDWNSSRNPPVCSDAKGRILTWHPNSPNTGSFLSATNANTEPQALSAAGNELFRNLCCSRIGSMQNMFGGAENFLWHYDLNHQLGEDYYDMWIQAPRAISFHTGWYQGGQDFYPQTLVTDGQSLEVNTVNGIYHNHGDQNPIVYHNGKAFVHRQNTLVAFGSGTSYGKLATVPIQTSNQSSSLPTNQDLVNKLETEVQRIVNRGYFNPAFDATQFGNAGKFFLGDLYHNPADTILTLSYAYPYLSSNLKSQVENYLNNFYTNYYNTGVPFTVGWNNPENRQGAVVPPDVTPTAGRAYTQPDTAYALYRLAKLETEHGANVNPTLQQLYDKAWSSLGNLSSQDLDNCLRTDPNGNCVATVADDLSQFPWQLNRYLAGFNGFLQLAQLSGNTNNNRTSRVTQLLNDYQNFRIQSFSKDSPWMTESTYNFHQKSVDIGRNFMSLVPEVGQWYRNNLYNRAGNQDVQAALEEYETVTPYWFAHHHNAYMGEATFQVYYNTEGMFKAKAWIEQASRDELAKYLDAPAYEHADLYYLQHLTAVLDASDEPPPPPPDPGDYHPYPDGDNDVDIDDFWEVVRNFVNRTYSIFNFNQVITHFGT